uniref:Uncharacterized protein n=1 Tax=Lepeophtheirus salmonis TaxID=72036 RepID=A0A0K2UK70_LEPSM
MIMVRLTSKACLAVSEVNFIDIPLLHQSLRPQAF